VEVDLILAEIDCLVEEKVNSSLENGFCHLVYE